MTMLYKAGNMFSVEGYDVDYIIADDDKEGELDGLLKEGWKKTIYETKAQVVEVTKDELVKKLTDAGVEFDKRLGIDKLKELANGLD